MGKFTTNQKVIILVCFTALFVMMGILTLVAVSTDDEDDKDKVETGGGGKSNFNFDVKSEGVDDVDKEKPTVSAPIEGDPYQELNELIGLASVKEEVKSLANYVRVQQKRKEQGLKTPNLSYHLVFTGNPGTGKTTVARIVARIYKDLGILKKGHLVETDRSGLIGKYVGQTAPRVNAMCDSALGGVLFIDEAYALTQKNEGDYGDEAVATLLKRMEDDRDRLVVIVAGYTNEMKNFINSNPGLESRFNHYIHFPDYSDSELYDIFFMYLRKNEYSVSKEAAEYLKTKLAEVVKSKDRNFGNARYVRNLFERTIQAHANRLAQLKDEATVNDLTFIKREDIQQAMK